jgi:hypothetical protein
LVLIVWLVATSSVGSPTTADMLRTSAPAAPGSAPGGDPGEPRVWFAPTMGSIDYPGLFSEPGRWPTARDRVDVFKFYGGNVVGDRYDIGGDNVLQTFVDVQAFRKLRRWGIAIALELGAVKPFECSPRPWADYARQAITNVETNGGRVRYVAMDEPLLGGQDDFEGQSCGFTRRRGATVVARFLDRVTAAHPDVLVGDIEPYPRYAVAELRRWLVALSRAGATPAFFHLDVDMERVRVEGQDVAVDLAALRDVCERRGIPFGVIMTSNWTMSGTDRGYYESTMEWIDTVNDAIGRPMHIVFQSWQGPAPSGRHEVPINLPEDDLEVYSHTRLIVEGLDALS